MAEQNRLALGSEPEANRASATAAPPANAGSEPELTVAAAGTSGLQAPEGVPEKPVVCVGARRDRNTFRRLLDGPEELPALLGETDIAWVNFRVADVTCETPKIAESLGFSSAILPPVLANRTSDYEDRGVELALRVPAVRVQGLDVDVHPLLVFIRKGLVLTVHDRQVWRLLRFSRYAEAFLRKIDPGTAWNDKLTIVLARILDENNERNFDGLRVIEEAADHIGKCLADPKTPRDKLGQDIYGMKHALITYLNMLWETLDVIHTLRYGDADVISDDRSLLGKIELLAEDVRRHIQLSENLSEVLASGLECLQSIYNNQLQVLSNRMAFVMTWLTILGTAVLVPNTIATVMSSGAFALEPADKGWYIAMLAGSTVIATWLAYFLLRRKLPADVE